MASFIADGYTEPFYVAAIPGIHEPLRGRFRRALGWENAEARRTAAQLKPREAEHHWAKFIKSKLIEWDLKTPDGKPVDLTEANLLRMNPTLNEALTAIVMSARASDADPETVDPVDPTPAEDRERTDAGNLPPA